MNEKREFAGYLIGFILFVVLVPSIMWAVSGETHTTILRTALSVILAIAGLGLSIWSIVHMRVVGKGNPMDAFNHEVAPRTSELMTDGPYAICRNPMLLGVLVYYLGVVVMLASWQAVLVYIAYALIMSLQVSREEKRLEQDFGDAYAEYKRTTKRLIPFVW